MAYTTVLSAGPIRRAVTLLLRCQRTTKRCSKHTSKIMVCMLSHDVCEEGACCIAMRATIEANCDDVITSDLTSFVCLRLLKCICVFVCVFVGYTTGRVGTAPIPHRPTPQGVSIVAYTHTEDGLAVAPDACAVCQTKDHAAHTFRRCKR